MKRNLVNLQHKNNIWVQDFNVKLRKTNKISNRLDCVDNKFKKLQ